MAFNRGDLYSSHVGTKLFNYFNPFVTKFDSQSFYNFEQDNQPLYDLEERTLYLWEKSTGYGTSSLFGMPLVVSGSAPSNVTTSGNTFTSLQAAVNALPTVIRTPTLIEVAASGYIGGLDLKNINVVEGGMLEIVNRGFAKIYTGAGNGVAASSAGACSGSVNRVRRAGYLNNLSSTDLEATIQATSAISVDHGAGVTVSSLFASRFNRTLVQAINFTPGAIGVTPSRYRERNDRLSFGFIDPRTHSAAIGNFRSIGSGRYFNILPYELNTLMPGTNLGSITDKSTGQSDVSATRGDTGLFLRRNNTTAAFMGRAVGGLTYCNALSSINIDNCQGPLYVRGFCVDSVSGAQALYVDSVYKNDVGIKVNNSTATIENCSVVRSKHAGARFINSDVTLSRGFFANRNYEVVAAGASRAVAKTAGLHAINSKVNLQIDPTYASGHDFLFNTQNHTYGALLENSVLKGGQSLGSGGGREDATMGFSYNDFGIKAVNSNIDLSGNLDVYNNKTGIHLINSKLSSDRMTVENQADDGILAENSVIEYNNTLLRKTYANDVSGYRMSQTLFLHNGTHLNLTRGSAFKYYRTPTTASLPTKMGSMRFADAHGVANPTMAAGTRFSLPGVNLTQSEAELMQPRFVVSSVLTNEGGVNGAAVKASDSSLVKFLGTQNCATIIEGPKGATNSANIAAVAAENNSTVSFRGPTVLYQFGAGIVARGNSIAEFRPHQKDQGILDISGFNLANVANHTSVEIHTTNNACIVAKDNSQLVAEDLGNAENCYNGAVADTDYVTTDFAKYVSGGSFQFYPNPSFPLAVQGAGPNSNRGVLLDSIIKDAVDADDVFTTSAARSAGNRKYNYMLNDYNSHDSSSNILRELSLGGLCVELLGNSTGYVNNVNFPAGWANPDGTYYDPSSSAKGCNQLRIWAVGDNSQLHMSHTGVSCLAPSSLAGTDGYHGPRATFMSGVAVEGGYGYNLTIDTSNVCYGAPSSTPGTGTLSILDFYGKGVKIKKSTKGQSAYKSVIDGNLSAINKAVNNDELIVGRSDYENLGPFRLFFGVNSAARFLGYPSGTTAGNAIAQRDSRPIQHLAQGYSLSGNAGVRADLRSSVSSLQILTKVNRSGGAATFKAQTSGYYYASAFSESDRGTHIYLDETAANVFANAKNCAYGPTSGRATPKVTIYRATTSEGGEGCNGSQLNVGTGLRSFNLYDTRRKL